MPQAHLTQQGQVDQARRTDTKSIRLSFPIAHKIETQLALWRLDAAIHLTFRRLEPRDILIREGSDRAVRDVAYCLLDDAQALTNLG